MSRPRGRPPHSEKLEPLHTLVPVGMGEKLSKIAERRDLSRAQLLRRVFTELIEAEPPEADEPEVES